MKINLDRLRGFKARAVSVRHLPELKEDLQDLVRRGVLDKKIEEVLTFDYEVPAALPDTLSLIAVAIPQPLTRLTFYWQGKPHTADIPPTYIGEADDARAADALERLLAPGGYKVARASLPAKTLAVRSGLARYGRNNVSYVPGVGSFHRLLSFATDASLGDSWGGMQIMEACADCSRCAQACPTRCIPADRFLVHAENCLTWFTEDPGAFPDWIKPDWHHAIVGCMRCQLACPVNKNRLKIVAGPVFSETETMLILKNTPLVTLDSATRQKIASIDLDGYYEMLGRNLALLLKTNLTSKS
jgi:epoxyqueuosine reductase